MTRSTVKSLAKEIANEILKKDESKATVKDAFEYYFRTKTVRPSTMGNKTGLLAQLKTHGYDDMLLQDINGATIREFLSKLSMKDSSLHATYSKLLAVLGHYVKENALKIELPRGLVKNVKSKPPETCEFLSWDELQVLLAVELEAKREQQYLDIFCLMCLSGMSVGDVLRFTPKFCVNGSWITYNRQKTGFNCLIPLLPQARKIIERNEWPAYISKRTIQNKCEHLVSDLVGRRIKSHGARKTFGAIALELNFSIEAVSKMMGHSTPVLTAKIYAKVTQSKIEREMKDMPKAVKEMMGI